MVFIDHPHLLLMNLKDVVQELVLVTFILVLLKAFVRHSAVSTLNIHILSETKCVIIDDFKKFS